MTTTLAELRTYVDQFMGNYPMRVSSVASGDGVQTVFMLPDGNLEEGSISVYVDDVLKTITTHYTIDYTTGELTFLSAPADGTDNIEVNYYVQPFMLDQVDAAINQGIYRVWPSVAKTKTDTTTITPASTTYEYALPADCAYLKRVDYSSADGQPYMKINSWRVLEDTDDDATPEDLRYLYLYSPPATGTVRLHYIPKPVDLSDAADTLEYASYIPTRAKFAVIYYACAVLKRHQLLRRSQTSQFHNAESASVVKLYELQRIVADFEAAAKLELESASMTPKPRVF
jgi:hypothetical protein